MATFLKLLLIAALSLLADAQEGAAIPSQTAAAEEPVAATEETKAAAEETTPAAEEAAEAATEETKEAPAAPADGQVDAATLEKELFDARQELADIMQSKKTLEAQVTTLQGDVDTKNLQIKTLNEEVAAEKQKTQVEKTGKAEMTNRFKKKVEDEEKLNKKMTELKQKSTSQEQQISTLSKEKDALSKQIADLQTNLASETSRLQTESDEQVAKVKNLTSQLKILQVSHAALKKTYDDPSVQHYLQKKAMKVYAHPGVSIAANKTFHYVMPSLRYRYAQAQDYANYSHSVVYNKLNAYVGTEEVEPYLPLMSGILVYGLLMIPLFCTISCLLRGLKVACGRVEVLTFAHMYFGMTCFCAAVFAFFTGRDALLAFAMHDASVYVFSQWIMAGLLMFYFGSMLMSILWCSKGREGYWRMLQIAVAMPFMLVYFFYVWTPMLVDEMPGVDRVVFEIVGKSKIASLVWVPYIPAAGTFLAELCLEVMAFGAAHHAQNVQRAEAILRLKGIGELNSLLGKGDIEMGKHA